MTVGCDANTKNESTTTETDTSSMTSKMDET